MASGNGIRTDAIAGNGLNQTTANNASNIINPIYSTLATGSVGYTPQQKSDALTASSQSLGGGVASAVGQGGLLAARTGEAGAGAAAIDGASQAAGRQQSQNALQVENDSTNLAEKNRQIGLGGLNSIYDTSNGAAIGDLNAANGAESTFWKTYLLQAQKAAASAASAGGA